MKTALGLLSIVLALAGLLLAAAGAFLPAIGLLLLALLLLLPVWMRGPRRLALGSLFHFLIFTLLIVGNLICIHLLVSNRDWHWDLTVNARHSLSPLTIRQVQALPDPVEIIAIANDPAELKTELDRLVALTPNLRYRILHPVRHHWEISRLASELQVANLGAGLVIIRAPTTGRSTMLSVMDDGKFNFDEQRWVNAMIQVTRADRPMAYFTSQSGERSLATEFVTVRRILENLSFEIDQGSLLNIPDEADLVIIAGPTRDCAEPEIDRLSAFCDRGGSVLLLLDPPAMTRQGHLQPLTNIERWVEENGVSLPEGVVAEDADIGFEGGTNPLAARADSSHPVTESFNPTQTPTLFQMARPLDVGEGNGRFQTTVQTVLYTNATQTWISPQAEAGNPSSRPLPTSPDRRALCLEAAITRYLPSGAGISRVVVFGDSDFLTDRIMDSGFRDGSERLLRGAIGWLVEEEDLIAIPPREPPVTPIALTPQEQRLITALSVVLLPELLLAIGVLQLIARSGAQRDRRLIPAVWGASVPVCAFAALAAVHQSSAVLTIIAALALAALLWIGTKLKEAAVGRRIALWGSIAVALIVGGLAVVEHTTSSNRGGAGLHPLAVQALSRIEHPIEIHTVAPRDSQLARIIETMAAQSPRISCEILDPTDDADAINALIQANETNLALGYTLINRSDGLTRKVVPGGDQQLLVNAMTDIGRRNPIRIHLTDGHGERNLESEMLTLGMIMGQLALVTEQGPLGENDRPDLILIAGPTEDFTERELEILDHQVERGAGLLVFLDPPTTAAIRHPGMVVDPTDFTNLVNWLQSKWALRLPAAIVVDDDPQLEAAGLRNMTPPVVEFLQDHPITRGVVQQSVQDGTILVLTEARPTWVDPTKFAFNIDAVRLMSSRSNTWAETDLALLINQALVQPDEERTSQPLAVACQRQNPAFSARMFLCGDSDILAGERPLIDAPVRRLINGSFRWVMPNGRWIHLADPSLVAANSASGSGPLRDRIFIAALAIFFGAAFDLARKRRPSGMSVATGFVIGVAIYGLTPTAADGDLAGGEHILPFSQGQIQSITVTAASDEITFTRDGDLWTFTEDATEADGDAVNLLLSMLESRSRHSQQALTASTDLASLGLDDPRVKMIITDRSGDETTLELGVYPSQSYTQVWARIAGEDEVFTIDDDILTMALRDRDRWEVAE